MEEKNICIYVYHPDGDYIDVPWLVYVVDSYFSWETLRKLFRCGKKSDLTRVR